MAYRLDELEVVGLLGRLDDNQVPRVFEPVLRVVATGLTLLGPLRAGSGWVESDEELSAEEAQDLFSSGAATSMRPSPARGDSCVYVGPGGVPEYVTLTDAHARLVEFASLKRRLGDAAYGEGRILEALAFWTAAASASEEPEDYARMLIGDVPADQARLLRSWIESAGSNADALVTELRGKLGAAHRPASDRLATPPRTTAGPSLFGQNTAKRSMNAIHVLRPPRVQV